MECPNCHHWNEANARFCEECGFELTGEAGAPAKVSVTGPTAAPPPPDSAPAPANPDGAVPEPSPQVLVAPDVAAPAPYTGPRLVIDKTGTIFKLGDATVIGREEPTVQIDFDGYEDGKYVSHRHAQIMKQDDKYYIEDLGSTNATRVNGVKLAANQAQPLKDGDKVRFGKIELTFHQT